MKMLAKKGLALLLAIVTVVGFVPNLGVYASAEEITVTVTYSSNGTVLSTEEVAAGGTVTLPEYEGTEPDGYTFEGWLDAVVDHDTTEPDVYAPGAEYTADADTTIYAVFSYTVEGGSGEAAWNKISSAADLTSGNYVMVDNSGHAPLVYDGSSWITVAQPVVDDDAVTDTKDAVWTLTVDGATVTLMDANSVYVAPKSTTANGIKSGEYSWDWAFEDDGTVRFSAGSGGVYLAANKSSSYKYRAYKSGTASDATNYPSYFTLYKETVATGAASVYTIHSCTADKAQNVDAVAPDCTEVGYEAGVLCTGCNTYLSGHAVVPATGHDYEGVPTPPTMTYTCSVCGDSYEAELEGYYTVSFSVPDGVEAVEDKFVIDEPITLPSTGAPSEKYEFLGWVAESVDNATDAPETIYEAGAEFTTTENVTLKALYTYSVGGSGSSDYVVTELSNIKATDKVIVTMTSADGTVYALTSGNGASKAPAATLITVANDKVTSDVADTIVWNIAKDGNNLTIYPNGTTQSWLYCTNANNGVRVGTGENKSFVVEGTYGYLFNSGTSRYIGVYNKADWRSYTPAPTGNSNIKEQTLKFYVKGEAGTTYYTTEMSHSHSYAEGETVCACGVVTAAIGDVEYTELTVALAAAEATDTVKLLADVTVEGDVDIYCTLDLNGNKLSASGVVDAANDDASITDSVGTGTATGSSVEMMPGNQQLAIDAQNNGVYSYETVEVKQKAAAVDANATNVKFYIDKLAADTKLDDAIKAGSDVKIRITVASEAIDGGSHSFVYSQDLVDQYAGDWDNKIFTCNITGLSELGEYTITAEVVSGGVTVEAITVA